MAAVRGRRRARARSRRRATAGAGASAAGAASPAAAPPAAHRPRPAACAARRPRSRRGLRVTRPRGAHRDGPGRQTSMNCGSSGAGAVPAAASARRLRRRSSAAAARLRRLGGGARRRCGNARPARAAPRLGASRHSAGAAAAHRRLGLAADALVGHRRRVGTASAADRQLGAAVGFGSASAGCNHGIARRFAVDRDRRAPALAADRRPPSDCRRARCFAGAGCAGTGCRRLRPLLHAIAERAQDRGEILARAAGQRRHGTGDGEAAAVDRARRLRARRAGAPGERRADQIGEPLENVDAHRALAADAIAGGAVERLGDLLVDGDRGAAAGGELLDGVEPLGLGTAMLERPELRRQRARRRLEQRRQIDVIGAEAHAVFAQASRAPAGRAPSPRRRPSARSSTPSASTSWKATPRAMPVTSSAAASANSGAEQLLDMRLEPEIEPRLHARRAARRSDARRR